MRDAGFYPRNPDLLSSLLVNLADLRELRWQDQAVCAEIGDPDLFFPDKGASTRDAKKVCQGCDVRAECLGYALDTGQSHGVWGGTSPEEREQIQRERRAAA